MNKKTITLILMLLLAVLGVKADVIPSSYYSEPAAGDFYLYNVSQGKFLDRLSSNFPTLTSTPVKFTLAVDGTGYTIKYTSNTTYSLHTGYWNNQYLWVDAGNASSGYVWTFDAIGGLTKTYQLKRTEEETQNGITGTFYANGTNAATSPTDDCKWALITEANYYKYLADQSTIPSTYYTATPVAGNTYYLYSPYASCFLYATATHAGFQNTPAAITLTASGYDFNILFSSNSKYLKYDAVSAGNTWANGTSGEAWEFLSFHGADGLFFIKHVTANSYLYSKTTGAAEWGGECWPTPETGNTRYAWALISEENYTAWQNSFVLDEATGYTATSDVYNVNPTVKRTMTANVWNTLVVPFDMAIPSGWTVMEPAKFEEGTLTFGTASSIVHGKPYIVKPTSDVTSFSASGVTIYKDLENTSVNDGALTMTGTYTRLDAVPIGSYVIGIKDGVSSLYQVNSTVSLKPFRAYFTVSGNNPGARVAIRFDDDTTGINVLEEENANENTGMKDGKYLENGRIIIVKNGVKYSTNGQIAK